MRDAEHILRAARVPHEVVELASILEVRKPSSAAVWQFLYRNDGNASGWHDGWVGYLFHTTLGTLHRTYGDTVMSDDRRELCRHLPIWMAARGRVLVTGLGLGCVVRGLLAIPEVEHIDVVELDPWILRVVGPHLARHERVTLHQANAMEWQYGSRSWNFAWHDLWTEDGSGALAQMHTRCFAHYRGAAKRQGAWAWDRRLGRIVSIGGVPLLGSRRRRPTRQVEAAHG